ncbi:RagB/SusD family nutrient uptake outer membrane protein [Bacteroides sp.]
MKSIKIYQIIISTLLLGISSCDLLDKDIDTNLTKEEVFSDERYAAGFLNSAYREIIKGYNRLDNAMMACASDEAICSFSGSEVHSYNYGAITSSYNPEETVWDEMYKGIRKTNIFLEELEGIIKSSGLIDRSNESKANYKRMKGEAFFLRAYYHFELAKRWGNIQLVDKVLTEESALDVKQSNFTEAIRFIVNDCDSAMKYLQDPLKETISDSNKGRATKASAIALKSRALLYLASPWNNPTDNKELWKEAADVAWEFIQATGSGSKVGLDPTKLTASMPNLLYISTAYSKEVLFASSYDLGNDIEKYNLPISFSGYGYTNPTQELVDCFEMLSGKTYDPENPYANLDRRFNLYFYYNAQQPLSNKKDSIFTYVGGKDGPGRSATATKTGYYMRKFTDFTLDMRKGQQARRAWIHFRFAEILLNYCEAMNEVLDVPDNTIYQQLNKLRTRAGIDSYKNGTMTKEEMREAIKKERRVELAFEEHRFWDVRRWLEGEKYFNTPIHGVEIRKTGDNTYSYQKIEVENRVYTSKMNWYPIPYKELLKNPNLKQNPDWK